jgi:hypothetical protein
MKRSPLNRETPGSLIPAFAWVEIHLDQTAKDLRLAAWPKPAPREETRTQLRRIAIVRQLALDAALGQADGPALDGCREPCANAAEPGSRLAAD